MASFQLINLHLDFKNKIPELIQSNIDQIQQTYGFLTFTKEDDISFTQTINLFSNNTIEIPKGIQGFPGELPNSNNIYNLLSSNQFIKNDKIEININYLSNLFNFNQYVNPTQFNAFYLTGTINNDIFPQTINVTNLIGA